jgi:hypothetical protein
MIDHTLLRAIVTEARRDPLAFAVNCALTLIVAGVFVLLAGCFLLLGEAPR